ncbi:PREDICTED: cinnamoyl-CoA reductase 1 [Camelina sativa]|uniref:Cinnamoyl-CoA reductase 1 n=1 Tax=Camelina sativa TaxID=90675 RepID=A0ABM0WT55_CAMSA|nr:PREDICTED: cinnamoyl-CoA reductase 1 [Camelina sativa]
MDGGGKVACVTGASGYIASWIVKLLLLRGYTVKATVRDPNDRKKTEHLLALDGAKERLKLFKAELLEEGSFQHAIDGCDSVFHTASPVTLTVSSDPQIELIDPAVNGTINVLRTCTKVSSVKRVILTSSMAAVLAPETQLGPNDVVDETFFTDPSFAEEKKQWYVLSKALAEDAAWRFAKANEMDLIVLNPGLVIGPVLHSSLNFSVAVIAELMKGKNPFNTIHHRFVDVRDVALAHVKALETPSANGRYIIDGPVVAMNDIQNVLREFLPDLCIADRNEDIKELNSVTYKTCLEKVKNLGIIELTPTETSLRDTVLSLKEKCLV